MIQHAVVVKTDNGFNGLITSASDPSVYALGTRLFNRNFKSFAKDVEMFVELNVSTKGRRVVKRVSYRYLGADALPYVPTEEIKPVAITSKKSPIEGYFISREARLVFSTAKNMSDARPARAVKIMMVGESGYGKTTLPRIFAEVAGYSFLRMNCATVRDPEEWFGYREARDGSTVFVKSEFAKALEKGHLVVVLDEFNRLEPWLHNTLFPLLDDDGATIVHDEAFRIGPNVIVVGTINLGYKYTGVFELDEALLNRFEFLLEVGPIPHAEEVKVLEKRTGVEKEVASVIVKTSNILRQNDVVCSTRTSLLVANMVVAGMDIREAFESAVVRRIPSDNTGNNLRKSVVDLVNVALGTLEDREVPNDVFGSGGERVVSSKAHLIQLYRSEGVGSIGMVTLITLIRRLPFVVGAPSLREAQQLAERIQAGETVNIPLSQKPDNFDNLIADFRSTGIAGRYKGEK